MGLPGLGIYATTAGNLRGPMDITAGGIGYSGTDLVGSFTGGPGSGLVFTYDCSGGAVVSTYITNGGTFVEPPLILFPHGGGSDALATVGTGVANGLSSQPQDYYFSQPAVVGDAILIDDAVNTMASLTILDGGEFPYPFGSWYGIYLDGFFCGYTSLVPYATLNTIAGASTG